ncbi:CRISPR-associated protein [Lacticaseibacillus brantae DSM 23927]|uniref:CRISPR-associated protein n=1 Tax=Lacticaseibacillus brantae DSM 23927 TaxID=1423727 RepID=A0A0R2B023_9LACO|nr:CRISPR-associated protein [Lacticaseibacillus brantae DSM 23927]
MQSYGDEANFSRRTTSRYPSKSAVVGMIAAALGYRRADPRILRLNSLTFAVRIDQPGTIVEDFHTVEWNAGKAPKITYRHYLQDAVYLVAIGSDDAQWLDDIELALKHPKFALFLGRRSNAPAGPLQIAITDGNPVEVLTQRQWAASSWYQHRLRNNQSVKIQLVAEATLLPNRPSQVVKDVVVSFDSRQRQHSFRAEASTWITLDNPVYESDQSTTHDIMRAIQDEG